MRIETLSVHAGRSIDQATGAVAIPLHLSTTFERDVDGEFSRGYCYAREGSPGRAALENALTRLEGGAACVTFSSGMAAISALLLAQDKGACVVVADDIYFGVRKLLIETRRLHGLEAIFVDMTDLAALDEACRDNPSLVLVESPSNPMLKVVDLEAVAGIARQAGARSACDNTAATPIFQRPLLHGFDYALHSLTKYVSGHNDAMSGAIVCKEEDGTASTLRLLQELYGFGPSAFDCWLALRGLQTLPVRMAAHDRAARKVARFLSDNRSVKKVHYPGLDFHPGHALARRYMSGFGALMSFELADSDTAFRVANNLKLFKRATSLGGTHSLVEHRQSVEGENSIAPPGLLRLSIGLEDPEDVIEDLAQALDCVRDLAEVT